MLMVITMTAGTGLIMWMGELITERGIGNGMSLLIFTSISATFPAALWSIQQSRGFEMFLIVIAVGIVIMAAVVFVEQSQRRIPVQYAKRMVGRRTYGGNNTYIPIKVNMAGVVPVIFASSLLYLPALIAQFNQPAVGEEPAAWRVPAPDRTGSGAAGLAAKHPRHVLTHEAAHHLADLRARQLLDDGDLAR